MTSHQQGPAPWQPAHEPSTNAHLVLRWSTWAIDQVRTPDETLVDELGYRAARADDSRTGDLTMALWAAHTQYAEWGFVADENGLRRNQIIADHRCPCYRPEPVAEQMTLDLEATA